MVSTGPRELAVLDQATRLLAEATSLDEIKTIRDKAEAARTYAKAAQLGLELQNHAAELKLRAERKAGRFLATMKLWGGDRKSKRHDASLKLEDLGLSRDQSKRWQKVASVAEEDFSRYLKDMTEQHREVTSAGLLRIAWQFKGKAHCTPSMGVIKLTERKVARTDYEEMCSELMNHCQLLASVLRPICEESTVELKRGEKRVIGRLIGEMTELIGQLKALWPQRNGR